MTRNPESAVVVDTGVFGARLTPAGHALAFRYRPILQARPVVISFITDAELRFGAAHAGWGSRRVTELSRLLDRTETVWPGPQLTAAYVELRAWCVRTGHGLGGKEHEADRWIAATARWLSIPLVRDDHIFEDVDGVELLSA